MRKLNIKAAADAVFKLLDDNDWFCMWVGLTYDENRVINEQLHKLPEDEREKLIRETDRRCGIGN